MLESAWKLVLAGAGPGLQNQRAAIASRVGSTPTSFRQKTSSFSFFVFTFARVVKGGNRFSAVSKDLEWRRWTGPTPARLLSLDDLRNQLTVHIG